VCLQGFPKAAEVVFKVLFCGGITCLGGLLRQTKKQGANYNNILRNPSAKGIREKPGFVLLLPVSMSAKWWLVCIVEGHAGKGRTMPLLPNGLDP
jgi:hypothetical protein